METRELLKHALTLSDKERAELASILQSTLTPNKPGKWRLRIA